MNQTCTRNTIFVSQTVCAQQEASDLKQVESMITTLISPDKSSRCEKHGSNVGVLIAIDQLLYSCNWFS